MAGDRMRRVNEAVREVLSDGIAGDLNDPRIGFVTVTAVETSPDLSHARVFVSVLGDERERERSLAGLRSSHGVLQSRVAGELRLKRTPTLAFVYDESIERGMRMTELLDEHAPRGGRGEHAPPGNPDEHAPPAKPGEKGGGER